MPNDSFQPDSKLVEPMSREDLIENLLADDDSEEVDSSQGQEEEEGKKSSKKDDTDTGKEEEGEIKEEGEEEEIKLSETERPSLEEVDLLTPPKRQEVLKKYPNVFKDFPYLEKALYRDQKWSEIFPSFDEAKEAVEKAKYFDNIRSEVLQGKTENVLLGIKETDEEAFRRAVDDYLPTLQRVDSNAYLHVVGNMMKEVIYRLASESQRLGESGEPLKQTALVLHQFLFGGSNFEPPKPLARQDKNPEREQLDKERRQFLTDRFNTVQGELASRVQNTLLYTIGANIDPKEEMTPFVKKNAVREAYEKLEDLIAQDDRFTSIRNRLWEKAFRSNFSNESVEAIRSAYVSKAKTLLRDVISKARNEALKGQGNGKREEKDRRGPIPPGRSSTQSDKRANKPGEIPRKMTTLEYLMQD